MENSFETAIQSLEEIARRLESGECTLDESIKLYEEGMILAKKSSELLNNAKLKISELKIDE